MRVRIFLECNLPDGQPDKVVEYDAVQFLMNSDRSIEVVPVAEALKWQPHLIKFITYDSFFVED
jgi:hypothetical protein